MAREGDSRRSSREEAYRWERRRGGFERAQKAEERFHKEFDGIDFYLIGRQPHRHENREATIPKGFQPSIIAIDGPLLPLGADQHIRRHVESVFIRAPFHNRCRPGLSHHGVGLELRLASSHACAQFSRLLAHSMSAKGGIVCR
jgi:hypothetical protein